MASISRASTALRRWQYAGGRCGSETSAAEDRTAPRWGSKVAVRPEATGSTRPASSPKRSRLSAGHLRPDDGGAEMLAKRNPGMTFMYLSGTGSDTTERGRSMWARVKGQTENALRRLPFQAAYMFRPGLIAPRHGVRSDPLPRHLCSRWALARVVAQMAAQVCDHHRAGGARHDKGRQAGLAKTGARNLGHQ